MFKFISKKDSRFLNCVVTDLMNIYCYSYDDSKRMVYDSALIENLDEMPEFVYHYSTEYWAKQVVEEYSPVLV